MGFKLDRLKSHVIDDGGKILEHTRLYLIVSLGEKVLVFFRLDNMFIIKAMLNLVKSGFKLDTFIGINDGCHGYGGNYHCTNEPPILLWILIGGGVLNFVTEHWSFHLDTEKSCMAYNYVLETIGAKARIHRYNLMSYRAKEMLHANISELRELNVPDWIIDHARCALVDTYNEHTMFGFIKFLYSTGVRIMDIRPVLSSMYGQPYLFSLEYSEQRIDLIVRTLGA